MDFKSLSHSIEMSSTNDTVIPDMLATRIHTDNWMAAEGRQSQTRIDDGRINNDNNSSSPRPSQSTLGASKSRKSKRPDSGHWETEVVAFSASGIGSRQNSFAGLEEPQGGARRRAHQRVQSSRPSSTMSGRESRAVGECCCCVFMSLSHSYF